MVGVRHCIGWWGRGCTLCWFSGVESREWWDIGVVGVQGLGSRYCRVCCLGVIGRISMFNSIAQLPQILAASLKYEVPG